jgi:hypothetical protein
MNDIEHAQDLLKLANADFKALTGMGDPEIFTDAIFGFHTQQAIEKGLKAWLAYWLPRSEWAIRPIEGDRCFQAISKVSMTKLRIMRGPIDHPTIF